MSFESELKIRVAREAAALIYCGAEKEYKQAKQKAASTFGTHFLPSNLEVALELNNIAEEHEGPKRNERLVQMRREAFNVMEILEEFFPVLVGSVWRGTIKRGSDIDIAVFADEPLVVSEVLKVAGVRVLKNNWVYVNKGGETLASFHIYAETQSEYGLEIVVRGYEEKSKRRRCETFGDEMKGLNLKELKKTLKTNPTQQFIPI